MAEPSVVFHGNFIPSSTVVMIKCGKVYSHLRIGKVLNGFWATAGGKFERCARGVPQCAEAVAADELFQEAGIDVRNTVGRLQFLCAVPEFSDKGIFICHVFLLVLKDDEAPVNTEPDKHADYVLDTVENHLKRNLLPGMRLALEHLQAYPEKLA